MIYMFRELIQFLTNYLEISYMIDYIIAIPTYKRYNIIKKRSLKLLENQKIPKSKIYIFVADANEKNEYKKILNDYPNIIIGKPTLKEQRNFIQYYFPEGQHIVQMDDDIVNLHKLTINSQISNKYKKKSMTPIKDLDKFIKNAFIECIETGFKLWGIYPIDNPYFMNDNITYDLRIIVGPFWGCINRHNNRLKNTLNEKEDIERTIKYYIKDGGVIRFNYISVETSYYKTPGGMQAENKDRKKEALNSAKYLVTKYPEYCKLNMKKKSGMPDVTLIRNPN